jgi:hypothetical protein
MEKRFFVAASRQTRGKTEPVWGQVEAAVSQADYELLREGLHALRFTARRDLTITVEQDEADSPGGGRSFLVFSREARENGKTSCVAQVEYKHGEGGQVMLACDTARVEVSSPENGYIDADLPVEVVMHAVYGVLTNAGVEVAMQMGIIPVWWTGRRPQYETRIDAAPTGVESSLFFALGARMLAHDLQEGDGVVPSGKFEFIPEDEAMFIPMVDEFRELGDDSPVEKVGWPPVGR